MRNLQYRISLTRPGQDQSREISTTEEYTQAYSAKPSDRGELAHKSFHCKMESFLRGELKHLLKVGWQPPRKIKLELTISED